VFISGYSNPETPGAFADEHGFRHDRMIANEPLDDVTAATNPAHSSTLLGQQHPVDQRGLPTPRTPSVLPGLPLEVPSSLVQTALKRWSPQRA